MKIVEHVPKLAAVKLFHVFNTAQQGISFIITSGDAPKGL